MANEYIFFHRALCDRFVAFAAARGVAGEVREDAIEGFVVALPDDLADDVEDAIETEYAALEEAQRDLVEAADGPDARVLMAVRVTLPDGSSRELRIPAHYARRLFAHFSAEEVHELVSVIAHGLADTSAEPLCRRMSLAGGQHPG